MVNQGLGFSTLCVMGCFLQEFVLYRESNLYKLPLSPGILDRKWTQAIIFALGCGLELFTWAQAGLMQALILTSVHLPSFKYFYSSDHEISFVKAEKISFALILSSLLLVSLAQPSAPSSVLLDFFIIYQICAITILIIMRKLGFFAGKVWFEPIIPAQLMVSSLTGLRVYYDLILSKEEQTEQNMIFPTILALFICVCLATSFVKALLKQFDSVIVLASYQSWVLVLGLFECFGLGFENTDLGLVLKVLAVLAGVAGNSLVCLHRIEFLKGPVDRRQEHVSAQDVTEEEWQDEHESGNLELQIVEDNLMDAEIIDEDLLIKTIRNI